MRITGNSLGVAPPGELLYGVTIGPIIEEVIYRRASFSVIYVTACSMETMRKLRTALPIALTSLLFAWSHRDRGANWLVLLGMGVVYALVRWQFGQIRWTICRKSEGVLSGMTAYEWSPAWSRMLTSYDRQGLYDQSDFRTVTCGAMLVGRFSVRQRGHLQRYLPRGARVVVDCGDLWVARFGLS